jgi:hypothetical protein
VKASGFPKNEGKFAMTLNDYGKEIIEEGLAHDRYDEALDDVYPEATVAGYTYQTSRALKEIDPIAYRTGFNEWVDSQDWAVE